MPGKRLIGRSASFAVPFRSCPAPHNVKQLRRFLGMVCWYVCFIERDSELKIPLVRLLCKEQVWEWRDKQQKALKYVLIAASVLARPDFSRPFTVHCDTSGVAIGTVLKQKSEGGERPIVYALQLLNATTRRLRKSV